MADKDELSRFIEGKLNQSDADRIVQELANSPELRALFAEMTQTNGLEGSSENRDKLSDRKLDLKHQSTDDPSNKPSIANYKMLQLIGEGGMGQVWVADQLSPVKRRVAVKLIKSGVDSQSIIVRFEAERQALALMDHPCIAKILDGGTTDLGQPFFAMELVQGIPLTDYCDRHRLSLIERLQLFAQVCDAVQHAHQKGIIHRDLKPSNVLVGQYDDKPVPKVIDFGLAKALGHQSKLTDKTLFTEIGTVVGTLQYMSPEQAEIDAVDIDTRSDIYSLGVLLYELLTGSTPIERSTLNEIAVLKVLQSIRELEPPRPSDRLSSEGTRISEISNTRRIEPSRLQQELRGDLDWIVMKALEKDRARRYDTANGFASDIRRYLADQPVLARPPSAVYRCSKFVKKHRGPVIAASAMILLLLAGLVGTSIGMMEAWRQTRIANEAKIEAQEASLKETEARKLEMEQRQEAHRQAALALKNRDDAELARGHEAEARKRAEVNLAKLKEAEAETVARVKDLEEITAFQASQLSEIDIPAMGSLLRRTLLDQFRTQLRRSGKSVPEIEAEVSDLDGKTSRMNFADASLVLLEKNVFERAERVVDEKYKDKPLLAASLLSAIGESLRDLGRLDAAEKLLRRVTAIRNDHLGADHLETLNAMNSLALILSDKGKFIEAEPLYREVLESHQRLLGAEHATTLASINNLATLLADQGEMVESESRSRSVLEARRRLLGDEHIDTLSSACNLALLLAQQGKLAEAEQVSRESLQALRRTLGNEHPNTLIAMSNLATIIQQQGRLAEAEPLYRETLDATRKARGNEHPYTLKLINNLGSLLQSLRQTNEAESLIREVLEASRRTLGNEHPDTLLALNNLARVLEAQGKLPEAESMYKVFYETSRRSLGLEHSITLTAINNLALCLKNQGKSKEAEPLYREALDGSRRMQGNEHPDTIASINNLARNLHQQGQPAAAEPLFREAMDTSRKILGNQNPFTLNRINNLAMFLHQQGRSIEAELLLREVISQSADREDTKTTRFDASIRLANLLNNSERSKEAIEMLNHLRSDFDPRIVKERVEAHRQLGQREECVQQMEQFVEHVRKEKAAAPLEMANALRMSARALNRIEDYQRAEPLAREGLELATSAGVQGWALERFRLVLSVSLLGLGRHNEARPILESSYQELKDSAATIPIEIRNETIEDAKAAMKSLAEKI